MRHAPWATWAQPGGNNSGLRNEKSLIFTKAHTHTYIYIHICICMFEEFNLGMQAFWHASDNANAKRRNVALASARQWLWHATSAAHFTYTHTCITIYYLYMHIMHTYVFLYAVIKEIPQATKSVAPAMPPIDLPRIVCNCTCNKQTHTVRNEA